MKSRYSRYRRRLKKKAAEALGEKKCCFCTKKRKLQAAHIAPTGLNGMGRGMSTRCKDIIKNPKHYRWMCPEHHRVFDNLMDQRNALLGHEPGENEEIPF